MSTSRENTPCVSMCEREVTKDVVEPQQQKWLVTSFLQKCFIDIPENILVF